MGEFLAIAQSSIVLPHFRTQTRSPRLHFLAHSQPLRSLPSSLHPLATPRAVYPNVSTQSRHFNWGVRASVISDSTMPTTFTADSAGQGIDILPETGGGGDDSGSTNDNGGGGGDNGGNSNDGSGSEGDSDESKDNSKKKSALSMSQKLTLGYAFLVGAGGLMGYVKGGSTKSLISGGVSASLLYFVYVMLPTQPVLASSAGFILSAALLGVMGSRFLKSKKIFPAGVVSFMSFVMTGGYLHGILRSAH